MAFNRLIACAAAAACAILPLAVRRHQRLTAERELKAQLLDKEIADLLEPADAMLALARADAGLRRSLARKGLSELTRMRDLGFLCKRMAMPQLAHDYARRASSQVQHMLAAM